LQRLPRVMRLNAAQTADGVQSFVVASRKPWLPFWKTKPRSGSGRLGAFRIDGEIADIIADHRVVAAVPQTDGIRFIRSGDGVIQNHGWASCL